MSDTPLVIPELGNKFVDYRMPIWGNSFTWSWERPITQVKYAVIHHTVTSKDATPDAIAALHKARGWGGIGYHFVIPGDGIVYYVGDIGTARANVKDLNEQVIGIALCGDFTKELPSDAQIDSAHKLVKYFISIASVPGIKDWGDMVGHQNLQSTACPGSSWQGAPDSMYERIKNNIPYTPAPTPPPVEPPPVTPPPVEPPPVEPPPVDPVDPECCEDLRGRMTLLEGRVTALENMTIWDWLRKKK